MTDQLLKWMSFRGKGRFDDFPAELVDGTAVRRSLVSFSRLGHLELPAKNKWRIAPPVLAGLPDGLDDGPAMVLCGARTPGVLDSLSAACRRTSAVMTMEAEPGQPTVVSVRAPSHGLLADVAESARIRFQYGASFAILACSPTMRNWPRRPCKMVEGHVETVRRFSRAKLDWVDSTLEEATAAPSGLFRIKRDWDWVSVLKTASSDCAEIDTRAGCLATAAGARAVSWSPESRTLSLPRQLVPPQIIARALVLCSGLLPQHDAANKRVSFVGVTPEIVRVIPAVTGLRLA